VKQDLQQAKINMKAELDKQQENMMERRRKIKEEKLKYAEDMQQ